MKYGHPLFRTHGHDLVVANALVWAALIVAVTSMFPTRPPELLPTLVVAASGSVLLVALFVRFYLSPNGGQRRYETRKL